MIWWCPRGRTVQQLKAESRERSREAALHPHNPLNRGPTQQLPRHILSSNAIAQLHTIKISRKQGNMKSLKKKLLCDWGRGGKGGIKQTPQSPCLPSCTPSHRREGVLLCKTCATHPAMRSPSWGVAYWRCAGTHKQPASMDSVLTTDVIGISAVCFRGSL